MQRRPERAGGIRCVCILHLLSCSPLLFTAHHRFSLRFTALHCFPPFSTFPRREISSEDMFSGSGSTAEEDDLPFEFKALELALELSCSGLDRQAQELAHEAYPLLERLAFQISTTNLELVRRIKSSLLGLTRRVQKVRDEIEQLMDDDGDMAEMYLTQKRLLAEERSESERLGGHRDDGSDHSHSHTPRESLGGFGSSISAPVSPAGSPTKHGSHYLDGRPSGLGPAPSISFWSGAHSASDSTATSVENVEELEMLLEAYFVVIDGTLNKLTQLSQYIDDTEDFINIQLDNVRNQLIQFELIMTTAGFVVALWGVIAGTFGMNVPLGLEEDQSALKWILIDSGVGGVLIFLAFLAFFRYKNWTITRLKKFLFTVLSFPTFPTFLSFPTFPTFPTFLSFPTFLAFPTFPTFPTFLSFPTFLAFPTFLTFLAFSRHKSWTIMWCEHWAITRMS
ncbi:unnamed protein product [Closterium sp. NIES-53]